MISLSSDHCSHTISVGFQERIIGIGPRFAETESRELVIQRLVEDAQGLLRFLQTSVFGSIISRHIEHIDQPVFKEQRAFIST